MFAYKMTFPNSLTVENVADRHWERITVNLASIIQRKMKLLGISLVVLASCGVFAQTVDDCIRASCRTYEDVNTLWCHADPGHFCQCRPSPSGTWVPQVMPCAPGTLYSFRRQTCVHPYMHDALECSDGGGGIDDPADSVLCEEVPCVTYWEINTLVCHADPKQFCQCKPLRIEPTVWVPVAMPCAADTSFSFFHQTCSRDELWLSSC